MRILILEPGEPMAPTASTLCWLHGYQVITASSASDALHMLHESDSIDAFLCDVTMMDGEAPRIAAVARTRGIPCIAITAVSDLPMLMAIGESGFTATLCKPLGADS